MTDLAETPVETLSAGERKRKMERDRARDETGGNTGLAFTDWTQLRVKGGCAMDSVIVRRHS